MADRKSGDFLDEINTQKYGFKDPENYVFKSQKGLTPEIVRQISEMKREPEWMLDFRLKALEHFEKMPMPQWGPDLSGLDLDDLYYYVKPTEGQEIRGTRFPMTFAIPSIAWASRKRSKNSWRVWVRNTNPKWCITASRSSLPARV